MAKPSGSSGTIPCLSLSLFLSLFLSLSLCTFVLLNLPLSLLDSPNSQWAETALIYMYHEFFLFSISCYTSPTGLILSLTFHFVRRFFLQLYLSSFYLYFTSSIYSFSSSSFSFSSSHHFPPHFPPPLTFHSFCPLPSCPHSSPPSRLVAWLQSSLG